MNTIPLALLSLLCVINSVDCCAKPARSIDVSISAERDDADRGVIGVRYGVGKDLQKNIFVEVVHVVPGGPAAAAGLKLGDMIVAIEGVEVKTLPAKNVGSLMNGAPGTTLHLAVKRGIEYLEITVTRGGLSMLPESAFKSRLISGVLDEDRTARIKALCQSLAATQPDICGAINTGNFRGAEILLQKAVKRDPNLCREQLLYALVLQRTGKPKSAHVLLEKVVAQNPKWPDAWQSLALSCEATGDTTKAIVALKKAALLVTDEAEEVSIRRRISELSLRTKQE